jgi:HAD superfamily hydrolase (TIGR01509 family)
MVSNLLHRTIKAVVFDLDGLMFNTEMVFALAGHELMGRRGKEWTPYLHGRMMGRRAEEAYHVLVDEAGLTDSAEDLRKESREIFHGLLPAHLQPMPGLADLLATIEACGLPKGVATSSSRRHLENLLGQFDLLERFPITLTSEDVTRGKPDPEIYLTAARRLGISPAEMMVLEDSEMGTRAGVAAGAVVISVPHEHSHMHDFTGAAYIAHGLHDPQITYLLRPEKSPGAHA